jgi:hypothetical protein
MPELGVSTTPRVIAVATAASTALPPRSNAATPASVASGWTEATTQVAADSRFRAAAGAAASAAQVLTADAACLQPTVPSHSRWYNNHHRFITHVVTSLPQHQ